MPFEMRLCCSLRFYWPSLGLQSKYSVASMRRLYDGTKGSLFTRQKVVPTTLKSIFCTYAKSDRLRVLGIETSCDDTGAAVVDEHGEIVGEALHAQTSIHVE